MSEEESPQPAEDKEWLDGEEAELEEALKPGRVRERKNFFWVVYQFIRVIKPGK